MNNDQLYPKTIEKLLEKIDYIIANEQNTEKITKMKKWVKWYNEQNYILKYKCKENEYLKIFYNNDKYALQIWKHNEHVDSIIFNLLSNFYSEYDSESTIVK